jgi:hypothetical protein
MTGQKMRPNSPVEADMMSNPDPNSYIQSSAKLLAETLSGKNGDYAPSGEFSNFEEAAEFADIKPHEVMLAQIGIKYSRIKRLLQTDTSAVYESIQDSLLDLAGYAVIAHAYADAYRTDVNFGLSLPHPSVERTFDESDEDVEF